ncbi:MAG TPA: hypothetical protein QF804_09895 [Rhodospirillales bacterium]|jgi:hypothetical protein|nr:hypothetical protein [Rhodospirillales bacterium]HJO69975.1 hypothetical protein [Rhodospirillales bacterium]
MRSIIIVPVCALGVGLLAGAADAGEPQALLVATQGEIALRCEAGECAADVTTICLQRDRDTPLPGTPYEAIELAGAHGALTLVGRTADGREVALTGRVPVALSAARGHLAVKLSVPDDVRERFGIEILAAHIKGTVVLAPVVSGKVADTRSAVELARALAALRPVAETVLSARSEEVTAAWLVHDVYNALPRARISSPAENGRAWVAALDGWRDRAPSPVAAPALARAQEAFAFCTAPWRTNIPLRGCLGHMHNKLMQRVNDDYWRRTHAGS